MARETTLGTHTLKALRHFSKELLQYSSRLDQVVDAIAAEGVDEVTIEYQTSLEAAQRGLPLWIGAAEKVASTLVNRPAKQSPEKLDAVAPKGKTRKHPKAE